jgi:hypothetical protein
LIPLASGTLRLTLAPIRFRIGSEVRDRTLRWPTREIQVRTEIADADLRSARPIWGIDPVPPEPNQGISMIAGTIVAIVVVIAGVILWRWRWRRPIPTRESARDRALRQIRQAATLQDSSELANHLSRAIREFLETVRCQPMQSQTTSELIADLRGDARFCRERVAEIERFLRMCDVAKFGEKDWDEASRGLVFGMAEKLIELLGENGSFGEKDTFRKNRSSS